MLSKVETDALVVTEAEIDAGYVALLTEAENAKNRVTHEAELLAVGYAPEERMSGLRKAGATYAATGLPVICGGILVVLPLRYRRHLPVKAFAPKPLTLAAAHAAICAFNEWKTKEAAARERLGTAIAELTALIETKTPDELAELWPAYSELFFRKRTLAEAAERGLKGGNDE